MYPCEEQFLLRDMNNFCKSKTVLQRHIPYISSPALAWPLNEEARMNNERSLSELYSLYIAGKLSRNDFEGSIFQYLRKNLDRYRLFGGNRDRWDEFLSWFYHRLSRAVDLYRDIGSSFDAYVSGLLCRASKEYRCREADHRVTEYTCWKAKAEEMKLFESEPEYPEIRKDVSIPENLNSRQVLFLLLKSYSRASDDHVKLVAVATGMESDVIRNMIDELQKRRSRQELVMNDMRERLHCQHYRCLAYQKRMVNALPGTDYYEKMKGRFERARRRFRSMKRRLGGMRQGASNRMIAEVLGISKGTVDSGLFAIKNTLLRR